MDENLSSPALVDNLNAESQRHECTFQVLPKDAEGFGDDELPEVCRREGATALLTNNKDDFGVEIALYRALMAANVSAVVLRLPNDRTERADLNWLTSRILKHMQKIIRELENANESLSLTVRKDKVSVWPVRELLRKRLM